MILASDGTGGVRSPARQAGYEVPAAHAEIAQLSQADAYTLGVARGRQYRVRGDVQARLLGELEASVDPTAFWPVTYLRVQVYQR